MIVIKFEHALWSLNNAVLVVARYGIKLIRTFVHIQASKILFEKLVALYAKWNSFVNGIVMEQKDGFFPNLPVVYLLKFTEEIEL